MKHQEGNRINPEFLNGYRLTDPPRRAESHQILQYYPGKAARLTGKVGVTVMKGAAINQPFVTDRGYNSVGLASIIQA